MAFFKQYPSVPYLFYNSNSPTLVKDILRKVVISEELKAATDLQFDYKIKEGQTAEEIADKIYGGADKSYIVYLMNNIRDIYDEWPMSVNQFQRMVVEKYGADNLDDIHHVEDGYGNTVDSDYERFDRLEVTNMDYETNLNEAKRTILLIKPEYLNIIEEEFSELIAV